MAYLSDPRPLWPGRDIPWRVFGRKLVAACVDGAIDDVAASVTFYCVVALFPLLIVVFHLVSRLASWEAIDEAVRSMSSALPHEVTRVLLERIAALRGRPSSGLITVGLLGSLWTGSTGIGSLMPALNRAYDVPETRPFWKRRLLALAVTAAASVASAAASLLMIAIPALSQDVPPRLGWALALARVPAAAVMVSTAWAGLYCFLPNVRLRFRLATPGSFVGVAAWLLLSWGFGLYARYMGSYDDVYGALGGVIVMLLWMWLSAMAFLLGAEINALLMPAEHRGAMPQGHRPAATIVTFRYARKLHKAPFSTAWPLRHRALRGARRHRERHH
jgi:membrane protein